VAGDGLSTGEELLRYGPGQWFRGNLHCHSDRSDGHAAPAAVIGAYREAGYDFVALTDHFEAEYGWQITDTRQFRDAHFTTLLGAELSSAPWEQRDCYWVTALGLPLDFAPPPAGDLPEAIIRARKLRAFVTLLHPGLNALSPTGCETLPGFAAIDAVEVYNHNLAGSAGADRANGAYLLDTVLERGRKLLLTAGDDAHFSRPDDRFGGWIEVWCNRLAPEALLAALRAGRFFSTQGPRIESLRLAGNRLHVRTSDAHVIGLTGGGDRWQSGTEVVSDGATPLTEADFDLAPFRGSYARVVVIDGDGRRAWSNPIWL
jgi:histidinol phosphatase-like PHP family hydrolase